MHYSVIQHSTLIYLDIGIIAKHIPNGNFVWCKQVKFALENSQQWIIAQNWQCKHLVMEFFDANNYCNPILDDYNIGIK